MAALGVNIDHIATVRQARRTYEPDPLQAAAEAELGGADGITVHLREDRRHIQDEDVRRLRAAVKVRFNLEMAATEEMLGIALQVRPDSAMLVPEGRYEVTTEGGLDLVAGEAGFKPAVTRLANAGVPVSVFIDPVEAQIAAAARIGAHTCEIHTGAYAIACYRQRCGLGAASCVAEELAHIARAADLIRSRGMRCNAGHGLNYDNVGAVAQIVGSGELHIGHSIVSRAVFVGLREAVRQMKALMN
ncbi:MAG: pyridoxine 5'-phosphate synthase [Phycisphaerales bacterium]|nr:pyridoxine 5'-phosphate synthase [Phycisphaerales bacterium]